MTVTDEFDDRYAQGVEMELTLVSGTYAQFGPYQGPVQPDLTVDVASGVSDIWTMPADEYENSYQQGDDVDFLTDLSAQGSSTTESVQGWIEGDETEFHIAVDNTPVYGSEPSGEAEFRLELVLALASENFFAFIDWLESEGIPYAGFSLSEGLNWWLLSYELDSREPSESEVATVRVMLLAYSDFVPDGNPNHSGLEIGLGTDGSQIDAFEIPAQLARRYRDDEISEEEYLGRAVPRFF